jgi:hypothetical protein
MCDIALQQMRLLPIAPIENLCWSQAGGLFFLAFSGHTSNYLAGIGEYSREIMGNHV